MYFRLHWDNTALNSKTLLSLFSLLILHCCFSKSVSIATGYGLVDRSLITGIEAIQDDSKL
jgi:hypothetical protein